MQEGQHFLPRNVSPAMCASKPALPPQYPILRDTEEANERPETAHNVVLNALTAQTPIDPWLLNTTEEGANERLETTHNVVLNALTAQIPVLSC